MTAEIRRWPAESLERMAYSAAATIPTVDPNDMNRLGYHVYLFLKGDIQTLADAVHVAQANSPMERDEIVRLLAAALESAS
jgi:hypothetical protein